MAFVFRSLAVTADYLDVELDAPTGPLGTRDYRILLEAIPLDGGRTFIHMRYAFAFGAATHIAMRLYLATVAANKVGFTVAEPGKPPVYVTGTKTSRAISNEGAPSATDP